MGPDYMSACEGASAIAILTEWDDFKTYDYRALSEAMTIVDATADTIGSTKKTLYDLRSIFAKE